jgi:endonuclease-8
VPEGDSYVHAAHAARPVLLGEQVLTVAGSAPSVRRYSARILGSTVTAVRTHGKHLVIDLESGYSVHVHLAMNGTLRVRPAGPVRPGPARLLLATAQGVVTVSGTRDVEADRTPAIEARVLGPLGPDLIADEFDWDDFAKRARGADPATTVADFLLDQRVMAGVGNVYKCEVAFLERLHPAQPIATLDFARLHDLAERSRTLLRANRRPGRRITTGDYRRPLWVYGRDGRACRRCGTAVRRAWFGSAEPRVTYWCPGCQPDDRASVVGLRSP